MVCDIGCGKGAGVLWLAATYPRSTFYGIDVTQEGITEARAMATDRGLQNAVFLLADGADLPADLSDKFDYILFVDTLHDIPQASMAGKEAYRVLKPGGVLSLCDINTHTNPLDNIGSPHAGVFYIYSLYNCLSVSMDTEGSEALGTCAGIEKLTEILQQAGFDTGRVVTKDLEESFHMIVTK